MYKSLLLAVLAGTVSFSALATGQMTVYKSQYCGCCKTWIKHMEENGFEVKVVETEQLDPIKQQHGITPQLARCSCWQPHPPTGHAGPCRWQSRPRC